MNLCGSYKALRDNSISAMLAAIEIYNKPRITYRDECFVILLINAWELLLKAILARHKQRIYYPKKHDQAYRTFSLMDSLPRARAFFPTDVEYEPVSKNIELLVLYRDSAIHFYNRPGFGIIVYGLAQTSITNYRDLMLSVFRKDIAEEMTINLLPLAFGVQPDPIEFLRTSQGNPSSNRVVAKFLEQIAQITQDLESKNLDTSRLLTVYRVSLKSVKKVSSADIVVGIGEPPIAQSRGVIVERRIDPNMSHPLRQKDILQRIGNSVNGAKFTSFTFQAIVWRLGIKDKPHLFWRSDKGELTRYSSEVVSMVKSLPVAEIEEAVKMYRNHQRYKKTE